MTKVLLEASLIDPRTKQSVNIIRGCKCHPNDNGHKMKVSYLRCVSALCIRDPDETCPFKYQIRECEENQTSYLYRV